MIAYLAEGIISGRLTYERVATSPLVQKKPQVLKDIEQYLIDHKREDLIPSKEPVEVQEEKEKEPEPEKLPEDKKE